MAEAVRLGIVRLTDSAPVAVAQARGLFAAEGLDADVSVEPSWANLADKLTWGALDAAVLLPPLAIAMVLGLRPGPPLVVPAGISVNGNAVTVAAPLAPAVLQDARPAPGIAMARLRAAVPGPLRLAVVHAFSTHDLLLRLMLEQGGVDPDGVEITVIPPQDMPRALADGQVHGFCAGAPWSGVAAARGVGRTIAVSSAVWPGHPEKCLAVRASWAADHPAALQAMLRALTRAAAICEAEGADVAALLSRPEWLGIDAGPIAASLPGGVGGEVDRASFLPALVPDPAHARWFTRQMGRWRPLPPDAEARAAAAWRPDLRAGIGPLVPAGP